MLDRDHVAWCRRHFDMMRNNGAWTLPSAGFVFRKRGAALHLVTRLPWDPRLSLNKGDWHRHQAEWLASTIMHFFAAGIPVIDETKEN